MDLNLRIKQINNNSEIIKLPNDASGFVIAQILENFSAQNAIIITDSSASIDLILNQIKFFFPEVEKKFEILNFPAWDCLPFDNSSPKALISNSRIKTLYKIANNSNKQKLILSSINAVLQKTLPLEEIQNYGLLIKPKSKITIEKICNFLTLSGYNRCACANMASEFAVRGGIVDFVCEKASDLIGYRIDFFGDEIESIKSFDPLTQLTLETLKEIEILPAGEVILSEKTIENFRKNYRQNFGNSLDNQLYVNISEGRTHLGMEHFLPFFYEKDLVSFFSYFNQATIFFNPDIFSLAKKRDLLVKECYEARFIDHKNSYHAIEPSKLYLEALELEKEINKKDKIILNNFASDNLNKRIFDLEIKPTPDFALASKTNKENPFTLFKNYFPLTNNYKIVICCFSDIERSQLNRILHDHDIKSAMVDDFAKIANLPKNFIGLVNMPLNHGFQASNLVFISEQDLLGEKIIRKKNKKDNDAAKRLLEEGLAINLGELVVHRNHGIGKFDGIHTITAINVKTDMIKILYGGGDVLFVPVDDINLITRYGADNPLIELDRLGVATWKNRREKVRKRIKVAAEELLKIAAARKLKKAAILEAEEHFYDEFKARFGFVETQDQMNAIEEVEEDLRLGSPMDRLICGDVGFGKTEVAMRAAAIVVSNNKNANNKYQVAIITPTTLLCRQHYKNFSKRFGGTNIKIAQLSRLVGIAEAKKTKEHLEAGEIDIVIGTHSLLQKNIKFKNLTLVIIDEEQHFGVAQKERLKELRNEVHVLNLSATPIPRTLQMSMTGVKDLSLIATPPIDRLAIRNFVMSYDPIIVREAVLREYNRSGRVFFVVPRVRDVEEMEPKLKALIPEIKITHAHGQMSPSTLEKIMNDFVDGKIDMLISTTIIESGIDISDANTMIIYKAEMFGLAQLYQLRGRVGRGKVRAYAYLMLDKNKKISDESKKKLEVMQNIDELGVGFTIASHDMDIRGSGNLLGDEQSGHVKETGVELYQQLLVETIENLKNNIELPSESLEKLDFSTSIKLGISLLIPENYISDLSLRMNFYKKIANIKNFDEQDKLKLELKDRFGEVPQEVLNLIEIAKLKHACKKLDIERLEAISQGIVISFRDNKFKNPDKLLQMIFSSNNKIKLHNNQRVLFTISDEENKLDFSFKVIKKLEELL
jgi:transcription-repair coupling factor (superfamily II helicase)